MHCKMQFRSAGRKPQPRGAALEALASFGLVPLDPLAHGLFADPEGDVHRLRGTPSSITRRTISARPRGASFALLYTFIRDLLLGWLTGFCHRSYFESGLRMENLLRDHI